MMNEEYTRAQKKLAALIMTDLDLEVTPEKLTAFIRKHWGTIAPLAHIIHKAPDYTK